MTFFTPDHINTNTHAEMNAAYTQAASLLLCNYFLFLINGRQKSPQWTWDARGTRYVNIAWVFLDPLLVLFESNKTSSSVQPSHESSSCVCTKTAFLFPLTALCHVFSIVLQLVEWCQCGGVGVKHTASPGPKLEGKPTLNHYCCCHLVLYGQVQSPACDLTLCLDLLCGVHKCVAPLCIKVLHVLQS